MGGLGRVHYGLAGREVGEVGQAVDVAIMLLKEGVGEGGGGDKDEDERWQCRSMR